MTDELTIPLYLAGQERRGAELSLELRGAEGPVRVLLPEITASDIAALPQGPGALAELSTEEILAFLGEVKALWADPASPLRAEALSGLRRVTGFHQRELELDLSYFPAILDRALLLGPTLEAELGGAEALEGWVRRGGSFVRAVPRGTVLHVLAGNVPGVELLSLVRGLLTKNANLLKVATGNPITPSLVMRSFLEVDADHPITRSTSVLYWPHGAGAEAAAYDAAQVACVWGGFEAVAAAYRRARPGLEILDYGPKRSMAFVDRRAAGDQRARRQAAGALAKDTVLHDQLACHCPQVVFVEGDASPFCEALAEALEAASAEWPRAAATIDQSAELAHVRTMSELRGDRVWHPGTTSWTVIATADFDRTGETPLGRTLYVLEVESLTEAVSRADPTTMVVGFASPEALLEHRDALSRRGVDRLTLLGRMGLFPPGMPQEGRYDLTRLVRWVSTDACL